MHWIMLHRRLGAAGLSAQVDPAPLAGFREAGLKDVVVEGGFKGSRLKTHGEVTIAHALAHLEKDGHVTNFEKASGWLPRPPIWSAIRPPCSCSLPPVASLLVPGARPAPTRLSSTVNNRRPRSSGSVIISFCRGARVELDNL